MKTSLQTSMCKGLRACGLRKEEVHEILNIVQKWYDCNGPEWTNARIKDLKAWYETYLAGDPQCPPWFRHSRSNLPLGVFGRVFRSPNPAKVFATLSLNTVFVNRGPTPSPSQARKFEHALNGNGSKDASVKADRILLLSGRVTPRRSAKAAERSVLRKLDPDKMVPPSLSDMQKHVPVMDGSRTIGSSTKQERAEALRLSWDSLPDATSDFLMELGLGEWIPFDEDHPWPTSHENVGRIACLQQPCLKARWIGNPHRITQALMRPLAGVWTEVDRADPCTCTEDQDRGVRWVQERLRQGVTLAGTDMTSASDLLDLEGALRLVEAQFFPLDDAHAKWLYETHVQHFIDVSRSPWAMPRQYRLGESVVWKQGWCLGTAPSFPLLSLVNASLARAACKASGIGANEFRVIGDDVVIDARAADAYNAFIADLGGEVNLSKTLTSDRVAEFAGRIITPSRVMRKTYRYRDPGDNGFMSYVSDLGPQALGLLRPRQRQMFEAFKYVPGIALDGPWSQDSFGEPLDKRLGWALTSSGLSFEARELPDTEQRTVESDYLYTTLTTPATSGSLGGPLRLEESTTGTDYLSVNVDDSPHGGDPRLVGLSGKTTLQHLEEVYASESHVPYEVWSSTREGSPETGIQGDEEGDTHPSECGLDLDSIAAACDRAAKAYNQGRDRSQVARRSSQDR